MPKDRQKWIDNAKGIAILLVIIGHVSGGLSGISFQFVYGIHLTMFFLLSGYTLKAKALTREYVSIKFRRLMVPYFYTCFAILITDVINCLVLFHDASIQTVTKTIGNDLVRSFFASGAVTSFGPVEFGTRIGAVWFLPALFFAIICFQFLLQKTQNASILGISTAAIALAGIISGRFLWFPFSLQSGMMASFFLWIGYEIKRRNVLTRIKKVSLCNSTNYSVIRRSFWILQYRFCVCADKRCADIDPGWSGRMPFDLSAIHDQQEGNYSFLYWKNLIKGSLCSPVCA